MRTNLEFLPGGGESPFSSTTHTGGWAKDGFGVVHLRGGVARASGTTPSVPTLPEGARPTAIKCFTVSGCGAKEIAVVVAANGTLQAFGESETNTNEIVPCCVSLDSITFDPNPD